MMTTSHLEAVRRQDFARSSLRELRTSGRVPAVVYGAQTESIPVHVDAKELIRVSRTGRSEFFDLKVEGGETIPVLIKDIQQRAGQVVHADFQKVLKNKPLRVKVPLQLEGTPEGTKIGGILQVQATELEVEGLPADLPAAITVDVTSLGTGDKLLAADVKLPDGITLIASPEELLASIVLPRVVDEDLLTSDEAQETGEVVAEGETPAE
ncbi:50S ribosomal protein L25 [Paenibacillus antibioticophila]|uniref:Large ribosomal subunit protein bL25 n=2 Tax=Paenibacillus antibioticophila TaxID=1274374 RepID=A0A919XME7_9BACL|nr:50S ribosomal protein L25 [Paenibacillus antibioticophila]